MRSNVGLVVTNLLNGGSYASFDKFWTKFQFQTQLKTDSPSSTTAANLVSELARVIVAVNLERLEVRVFLPFAKQNQDTSSCTVKDNYQRDCRRSRLEWRKVHRCWLQHRRAQCERGLCRSISVSSLAITSRRQCCAQFVECFSVLICLCAKSSNQNKTNSWACIARSDQPAPARKCLYRSHHSRQCVCNASAVDIKCTPFVFTPKDR